MDYLLNNSREAHETPSFVLSCDSIAALGRRHRAGTCSAAVAEYIRAEPQEVVDAMLKLAKCRPAMASTTRLGEGASRLQQPDLWRRRRRDRHDPKRIKKRWRT